MSDTPKIVEVELSAGSFFNDDNLPTISDVMLYIPPTLGRPAMRLVARGVAVLPDSAVVGELVAHNGYVLAWTGRGWVRIPTA